MLFRSLLSLQSTAAKRVVRRALARTQQRDERARGRGVLDDAAPRLREADHLPHPVARDLLELRERGARLPREAQDAESGAKKIAEHARWRAVAREVAEELRMLPMREPGYDHALDVAQDRVEWIDRKSTRLNSSHLG